MGSYGGLPRQELVVSVGQGLPRAAEELSLEAPSTGGPVPSLRAHMHTVGYLLTGVSRLGFRGGSRHVGKSCLPSGTSLWRALRSAAALAHSSAFSLPWIPRCSGARRIATSLSLSRMRVQTSTEAFAKRWPGPVASVSILLIAAVESTKMM